MRPHRSASRGGPQGSPAHDANAASGGMIKDNPNGGVPPASTQGAQTRDVRAFHAIQSRIDISETIKAAVDKEAERHYRIACARVAEADELAVAIFRLTSALARIERRLLQPAPARKANGRAA